MDDSSSKQATPDDITALLSYTPLVRVAALLDCHVATLYRWTNRGCRGAKLRYAQRGATRCTTREWVEEFFSQLTRASQGPQAHPGDAAPTSPPRTPDCSRAAAEGAGQAMDRLWGRPPSTTDPRG